jgi:hypothetical protein
MSGHGGANREGAAGHACEAGLQLIDLDTDAGGQGRDRSVAFPRVAAPGKQERRGYRLSRGSLIGRGGTGSGFQLAMVRTHARASALSITPGNNRRNSIAADSSPCCSNTARIAAASASVTTNIAAAW